jgi:hypothetical protein
VQKHFFNGGAIDNPVALARWQSLRSQLSTAILAESARWGDAANATPRTVANWNSANNTIETGFLATRRATLIGQLRARSLFPSFDAPAFSQHGGIVPGGYSLGITGPVGTTIYYTVNGTDPQLPGSPTYSTPVALQGVQVTVKSRAKNESTGEWSALTEAVFTLGAIPAAAGNLAISEIHYNPAGADDSTEFVEITNVSTSRVDLTGANFTGAMIFTFGNTTLEPGARVLVVESATAFATVYGATPVVAGQWSGALNNGGDTIILRDKNNAEIDRVAYSDSGAWPTSPDGGGYSLVRINPLAAPTAANWRSSSAAGGNPGASDSTTFVGTPMADADADGMPALLEYFFGSSDTVRDSSLISPSLTLDGRQSISFVRKLGTDDLTVVVEASADLNNWTLPVTRTTTVTNPNGTATETWTIDTTGTQQFMRIRVVRP